MSVAWFIRRDHGANLTISLVWAGLLYAPSIAMGLLIWLSLRLFGAEWRAVGVLAALTPPTVALSAWSTTMADAAMRQAVWSAPEIATRVVDRLPVALLLYTAIAATGLAAAHWRRVLHYRAEMQALSAALAEARRAQSTENSPERLMVSVGRGRVPVDITEIEWIASAGNYAVVHWRDREGLLRETLQALESRLAAHGFARSHRSTLLNLARVCELKPLADGAWLATLDSGADLVVSRSHRDGFLARLKQG